MTVLALNPAPECKYLSIPITTGMVYGVRYTEKDFKLLTRMIGPFYSIGVAVAFYIVSWRTGTLKEKKARQYIDNLLEQLTGEKVVYQTYEDLQPFSALSVDSLETHKGPLTLNEYLDQDPTIREGKAKVGDKEYSWRSFENQPHLSVQEYWNYRREEKRKREEKKKLEVRLGHDQDFSVYVIDFKKHIETPGVNRISIDNKFFTDFVSGHNTKTRIVPYGKGEDPEGVRVVFSSGQNINERAMVILYGKQWRQNQTEVKPLKGMVYVVCTKRADLKLRGYLPIENDWEPKLDLGDQEEPGEKVTEEPKPDLNPAEEESDEEEESDDDDVMEEGEVIDVVEKAQEPAKPVNPKPAVNPPVLIKQEPKPVLVINNTPVVKTPDQAPKAPPQASKPQAKRPQNDSHPEQPPKKPKTAPVHVKKHKQ